jgi:WD40 repeat protein
MISVWDKHTFNCTQTITLASTCLTSSICVLDVSNIVYFCKDAYNIKKLNLEGQHIITLLEGIKTMNSILKLNNDKVLLSFYRSFKILNINNTDKVKVVGYHNDYINEIIKLENDMIASCSNDCTIKIWCSLTNHCISALEGHNDDITNLIRYSDDILLSASMDGKIKFWNYKKHRDVLRQ